MQTTIQLTTGKTLGEVFRIFFFHGFRFCNFFPFNLPAVACEVLARRLLHLTEPDKIKDIMAKRYQHRQIDGDDSEMSSALEMAIDQHWSVSVVYELPSILVDIIFRSSIFLSSTEAQEGLFLL